MTDVGAKAFLPSCHRVIVTVDFEIDSHTFVLGSRSMLTMLMTYMSVMSVMSLISLMSFRSCTTIEQCSFRDSGAFMHSCVHA